MESLGYSNIFQECSEHLLLAEKQIKDKEIINDSGDQSYLSLSEFWKELDILSKKLSFECTKLCISFSNTPTPSSTEASALLQDIEKTILAFVSLSYTFDPAFGKSLHDKLISCLVDAVQLTRQLIRIIKDDGGPGVVDRYRQATGIAWEGCKSLEACPKDNKEAVLSRLKEQSFMVCDAFEEITDALDGGGKGFYDFGNCSSDGEEEEEPSWTEQDKSTMNPTVNIIKAAKALFTKLVTALEKNGNCNSLENIKELDQILEDCQPVSQTIDCLILEIYPPLDVDNMEMQTNALASQLHTALKTVVGSHVITENEKSIIEFINRAVDHNLNKMKQLLRNL